MLDFWTQMETHEKIIVCGVFGACAILTFFGTYRDEMVSKMNKEGQNDK